MTKKIFQFGLILLNTTLIVLVIFHDQLEIPAWLQVFGRMHPMFLHLPIGSLLMILAFRWFKDQLKIHESSSIFEYSFTTSALLTVLTAIAGCLLAGEDSYSPETIDRHMVTGTILSLFTLVLSYLHSDEKLFRIISIVVFAFLLITGHFGSVITHGENFILEPVKPTSKETLIITDSTSVFEAGILPVLEKKCNSCHNPSRKKGGLDMSSWEALNSGGENGQVWNRSDFQKSEMLLRIHLPLEDDEHMPPAEKQQLTAIEKDLIELFIKAGASLEIKLGRLDEGDSLRKLARLVVDSQKPFEIKKSKRPFNAASEEKVRELNNASRTVRPLAADDPALRVGFYLSGSFKTSDLEELNSVAEQITELYLSGMPVQKGDLTPLKTLKNLETLFLNNTHIDDRSLEVLQQLPALKKISVSNTKITEKGLQVLLKIKSIEEIAAWSINANQKNLNELVKNHSEINWILGDVPDQKEVLKLTPPLLVNESRILKTGEKIGFRHNLPGVIMRYSIGADSDPDSVSGKIYTGPIAPDKFTRIKIKAFKDGWRMSTAAEATFFTNGLKPTFAKLLTPSARDYRANGANTLTDAQAGDQDNHRDGQWLGYRENPLNAIFEFNESALPESFTISYLKNTGSYILPPAKIKVFAGNTPDKLDLIREIKPKQPSGYDRNEVLGESVELNKNFRFIKIHIEPVEKLPQWHSGKGQRGWIFIDEVFFYPGPTI